MAFRTEEEMYPLVRQWLSSGESQQQFSQQVGLPVHVLQYWASKYRRGQPLLSSPPPTRDFVPLSIGVPPAPTELILHYPNGVQLQLKGLFPSQYIGELLNLPTSCSV